MTRYLFILILTSILSCNKNKKNKLEVIFAIQNIGLLITTSVNFEKIAKATDTSFLALLGDRKILIQCDGKINYGINLKNIKEYDIEISENKIKCKIPKVTIQEINIDANSIKTIYQNVGIFRKDFSTEEKNRLMQEVEGQIRAQSEKIDISTISNENTKNVLKNLFNNLGYNQVEIITQ